MNIKKIATALTTGGVFYFATTASAFAQLQLGTDDTDNPLYNAGGRFATDPGGLISQLIWFIFVVAVILALGFLVYGGIKWLTSGGDKDSVAGARGTIIAAIIGLIIIFLSYVILNFVVYFLTGAGLQGIEIPSLSPEPNPQTAALEELSQSQ